MGVECAWGPPGLFSRAPPGPWTPRGSSLWRGWGLPQPPPLNPLGLEPSPPLGKLSREFELVVTSLKGWGESFIHHMTNHMGSPEL